MRPRCRGAACSAELDKIGDNGKRTKSKSRQVSKSDTIFAFEPPNNDKLNGSIDN